MGARAAMGGKLDGAIGNRQPQRGADRPFDQTDFAAVGAHQFSGDRKSKPGAAGTGRALKGLEQMRPRLFRKARSGIGNLDNHHRAFAAASNANLIPAGVAVDPAFGGLAFQDRKSVV